MDRQKAMHESPPCMGTGGLKKNNNTKSTMHDVSHYKATHYVSNGNCVTKRLKISRRQILMHLGAIDVGLFSPTVDTLKV